MNLSPESFPTSGYVVMDFNEQELAPIKEEVEYIKNNESSATKINETLAGHLKKEYLLEKSKSYLQDLLMPVIDKYVDSFGFPIYVNNILSNDAPYYLDTAWVNFQQKHEFNPLHEHSGIFSFVIWLKVPYGEEEKEVFSDLKAQNTRNGCFEFVHADSFGLPRIKSVFADRSYEGKGLFFPSMIKHCVNPFYSSDDYRISISGNIKLRVR